MIPTNLQRRDALIPTGGRPLRLAPPGWPRTAQSTPAGDRCVWLLSSARCRQMRIRAGGRVFLPDGEAVNQSRQLMGHHLARSRQQRRHVRRHARLPLSLVRRQLHRPCAGRPAATSANSPVVRVQRNAGRDPRADCWSVVWMEYKGRWRTKVRSASLSMSYMWWPPQPRTGASHSCIQSYNEQGLQSIGRV